jgi:hypothetical protein
MCVEAPRGAAGQRPVEYRCRHRTIGPLLVWHGRLVGGPGGWQPAEGRRRLAPEEVQPLRTTALLITIALAVAACSSPVSSPSPSASAVGSPSEPPPSAEPTDGAGTSPSAVWLPEWADDAVPAGVAARRPLPFCGIEQAPRPQPGIFVDAAVRSCFWDAHVAGREAEFVSVQSTMEGAPLATVYRLAVDGSVEVLTDWSQDPFGAAPGWTTMTCDGLVEAIEGTEFFGVDGCDEGTSID